MLRRHERQQVADGLETVAIVLGREVRDAARRVVGHRAAERFLGDLFVGDRLDHVGAGHEHVARVLDHDGEIGDRGRVDGAAGAGSHDRRDLRHDARRQRVAQEDVGVAAERDDAFLNARAAGIVQADDRRTQLERQVHDLDDLGGVGFRQRSAEHREVLGEGEHLTPVDQAVAGDDAVAGNQLLVHAEIAAAVGDEPVELFERARIEEQLDPLASGQLAGGVLALEPIGAAAKLGAPIEIGEDVFGLHRVDGVML